MPGTGAVTSLATDVDLRPGGAIAARRSVITFAEVGGVALGTLVIPRLIDPGPMQAEVEPPLAAARCGPRIPCGSKNLQSPACCGKQVLLQRIDAEGVCHWKLGRLAVRARGANPIPAVAPAETRSEVRGYQLRVAEISHHACRAWSFHGP